MLVHRMPYSEFWPMGGLSGILHHYTETLVAFEYTSSGTDPHPQPHSILFVGGLGDGLATTSYTADLVRALQPTAWSFFTLTLTSSYRRAWGLGRLDEDADEIATCIRYISEYKRAKFPTANGKIVLMGHSTGSQCTLHYLYRPNPLSHQQNVKRMPVDGAIMQAPVSDREAILGILRTGFGDKTPEELRAVYDELVTLARETVREEGTDTDTLLPLHLTSHIYGADTPLSARRFLSLASPDSPQTPGEDDLFSSELDDAQLRKTFGMIRERGLLRHRHKLMVLMSGADASVPDWVDKKALLSRWKNAADHGDDDGEATGGSGSSILDSERSGIIPGASHALSDPDQAEPRKFLVERVLGYLDDVLSVV